MVAVVSGDTGDGEEQRNVATDRIAGGLIGLLSRIPFIEDPAVMPNVRTIIAAARREDVRYLRPVFHEGDGPISFTDTQIRAAELMGEFCIRVQKKLRTVASTRGADFMEAIEQDTFADRLQIAREVAGKWVAACLPNLSSPQIEEVIVFMTRQFGARSAGF